MRTSTTTTRTDSPGPRYPHPATITPADVMASLKLISQRRAVRASRLSPISRLRGNGGFI